MSAQPWSGIHTCQPSHRCQQPFCVRVNVTTLAQYRYSKKLEMSAVKPQTCYIVSQGIYIGRIEASSLQKMLRDKSLTNLIPRFFTKSLTQRKVTSVYWTFRLDIKSYIQTMRLKEKASGHSDILSKFFFENI